MPFVVPPGEKRKEFYVQTRVSKEQEEIYKACAAAEGIPVSRWMRNVLDHATREFYKPEINQLTLTATGRYVRK